ncbi:hypothetical protein L6Q96_14405 [Candidatus Binatia bacterium]|nr:hypothetical protein [Candidatus Binatia bacterium]
MPISGDDPNSTLALTQQYSKPDILQRMDLASLNQTQASLKVIRDQVKGTQDLAALGIALNLIAGPAEELHIRDHWFDESGGGWFKSVPNVKARIRAGFLEVLRLLRQSPRPLQMFLQVIPNPPGGGFTFSHLLIPNSLVVILTVPTPQVPQGTAIAMDTDDVVLVTAQFGETIETRFGQVGVGVTMHGTESASSRPSSPAGRGRRRR